MRKLVIFCLTVSAGVAIAQAPVAGRSVMVDPSTYSLLGSFTNFFKANSNLLIQAVSAGSITGAVQSVNGKVGAVVLDASSIGAQPLSPALTAWSAVSPTAKQNTSANLSGWSAISPFTTNNFATIEYANRAMTNGFTPNAYFHGTSNRFSGALSVAGGLFGYGGLTIDEGLQKTLRVKSPASGYQGLYFGANAASPDIGNYGLIGDTYTTALNAAYGPSAEVSLRVGNLKVAWATNTSVLNVNGLWAVNEIKIAGQSIYESAGVLRLPHIYVEDLDFTTLSGLVPADQLTGTISPDKLGSGTPSSGTVLCGDGVWRVVAGASGDVLSVNGMTGDVTLSASSIGAQGGSANLTNWTSISTNIITDLRQEIADTTLDFVPQYGSVNLTNWSAITPSSKQDALGFTPQYGSANLTNWSALLTSAKQDSSENLTAWSTIAPSTKQAASANLNQWSGVGTNVLWTDATNLTGTIDVARLPAATNAIWGGINLSNQTAIYMLTITTNTTLGAFGNMHASEFRTASLWVTNGAGSNCSITLPAGTSCPDGTTLYCTNGQRRVVSVGGLINFTNAISRALP